MRVLIGIALLTLTACASQAREPRAPLAEEAAPDEEKRPGDHLEVGGKTSLASFALGGRVTAQAFVAVGSAVGGLFEDGFDGAERRWDARVEVMRDVARLESDKVAAAGRNEEPSEDPAPEIPAPETPAPETMAKR